MVKLSYSEEWGEEHDQETCDRTTYTDADVLLKVCQLLDEDPLAFFILSQRLLFNRTYQQIADRLIELNPRKVSKQRIYERMNILMKKSELRRGLFMPRSKEKIIEAEIKMIGKKVAGDPVQICSR